MEMRRFRASKKSRKTEVRVKAAMLRNQTVITMARPLAKKAVTNRMARRRAEVPAQKAVLIARRNPKVQRTVHLKIRKPIIKGTRLVTKNPRAVILKRMVSQTVHRIENPVKKNPAGSQKGINQSVSRIWSPA